MVTHPPRYRSEVSHSPRVSPQNPLPPQGSLFPLLQSSPTNKRDTSGILFIDLVLVKLSLSFCLSAVSLSLFLSVCPSLSLNLSLSPPVVSYVFLSHIFHIFGLFILFFSFLSQKIQHDQLHPRLPCPVPNPFPCRILQTFGLKGKYLLKVPTLLTSSFPAKVPRND